jgi:exodeoxyribonuclease V alpha subunit
MGIAKDSPLRAQAGISHALTEASTQGHCGLPDAELVPLGGEAARHSGDHRRPPSPRKSTDEVLFPDTVDGQPCVFLAPLYYAEQSIAAQIKRLKMSDTTTRPVFDTNKLIPWVEKKLAIQLADSQKPPSASPCRPSSW